MQNEAFFSGLFHDVGKLLILVVIERKKKKDKGIKINNSLLLGAMDLLHPEQGANLMEQTGGYPRHLVSLLASITSQSLMGITIC